MYCIVPETLSVYLMCIYISHDGDDDGDEDGNGGDDCGGTDHVDLRMPTLVNIGV